MVLAGPQCKLAAVNTLDTATADHGRHVSVERETIFEHPEVDVGRILYSRRRRVLTGVLEAVLQAPEGGSRMQLAQWTERDAPIDMGTAMWKLYVNTDDCAAVYARAIGAGCESVSAPERLERWPVTVAFVRDPDGYLLELIGYHKGTRPGVPHPKASTRE